MSSFFTLPASQRKRKRSEVQQKPSNAPRKARKDDDDSISGSDVSDEEKPARIVEDESEDDEGLEDEDPASKRIRLAEQYLANTHKEVLKDDGFDAADVDEENLRRRMGERLKQDTAESKGKLYRWIGEGLDWRGATAKVLRPGGSAKSFTGVAMHGKFVYAVSKDQQLIKWAAPAGENLKDRRPGTKWRVVAASRGKRKNKNGQCHNKAILCVAVSPDGKFIATGGMDKKLIIWNADTLAPLRVFTQHRDAVTALAFRKGTNQLFSASKDRTIKIWSLNELAYVETLFGHQDEVVGVSALAQEKCVTAGARDRTARLWKVVEESQLVFRGGGAPGTHKALESLRRAYEDDSGVDLQDDEAYHEGSIDQVAMVDDDTFITASDNGSLSLWNVNKKKAVYTLPLSHGTDPPLPLEQASAETDPDDSLDVKSRGGRQPRWVTALAAIPFSDVIVSGSWDGYIRAWKITQDKRRIEPLGAVGALEDSVDNLLASEGLSADAVNKDALEAMRKGAQNHRRVKGVINDLAILETGDRGKETVLVAAATGKEHRLGRWKEFDEGTNCIVLFEVARKNLSSNTDDEDVGTAQEENSNEAVEFAGFNHPASSYAQKVRMALREKGIPFDMATPENVGSGQQISGLAEANPRMEVPALEDGDFKIFDSKIILQYLEDKYPEHPLMPKDARARAEARMIEEVCDTAYEAINWGLGEITWCERATGDFASKLMKQANEHTKILCDWLSERLGDKTWFNGDEFGYTDICVAPYVNRSCVYGNGPAEGTPLRNWRERVMERPAVKETTQEMQAATQKMAAVMKDTFKPGSGRRREYRDHRLEWMIKAGGFEVVEKGLKEDTIRFSWPGGI